MKQKTVSICPRVSPRMARLLKLAVSLCGRGMSQGLFLERCFERAHREVISSAINADVDLAMAALDNDKEPTQ